MVTGVCCFEMTEAGKRLTNIIYLKDNMIHNKVFVQTPFHHELEEVLDKGYVNPQSGEHFSIQNPEAFLKNLKNRFFGSYFFCGNPKEISEEDIF